MSALPAAPAESEPPTFGAAVALAAALAACFVGSTGPIQHAPLLLEGGGLALFGGGVGLRRRGRRLAGRTLALLGFAIVGAALAGAVALAPPLPTLLPLLSCGLGAAILALGAFPVFGSRPRPFVLTGFALVLAGVLATAAVADPPLWRSAVAVSLTFLSWDGADRAQTLGRGVGSSAETASVELLGVATSAVVTVVAILFTVAVSHLPTGTSSLPALALFLLAAMAFVLALSQLPRASQ